MGNYIQNLMNNITWNVAVSELGLNTEEKQSRRKAIEIKVNYFLDKILSTFSSTYQSEKAKVKNNLQILLESGNLAKNGRPQAITKIGATVLPSSLNQGTGKDLRPPILTKHEINLNKRETERSKQVKEKGKAQRAFKSAPGYLIQQMGKIHSLKTPTVQGDSAFNNFKRQVLMGKDENEKPIVFLKAPSGKYAKVQTNAMKNEELAFLISERLSLNVVPLTKLIAVEEIPANSKLKRLLANRTLMGEQIIVQEAVTVAKHQPHLEKVVDYAELKKLDLNQIHQLIIFNLLLGRHDGRPVNTVLDDQGNLIEVDNEFIGLQTTDSWLLEQKIFHETVLSEELIQDFLKQDRDTLIQIFNEMNQKGHRFDEVLKRGLPGTTIQNNILCNFDKLRAFFLQPKNKPITVADLVELNKSVSGVHHVYESGI